MDILLCACSVSLEARLLKCGRCDRKSIWTQRLGCCCLSCALWHHKFFMHWDDCVYAENLIGQQLCCLPLPWWLRRYRLQWWYSFYKKNTLFFSLTVSWCRYVRDVLWPENMSAVDSPFFFTWLHFNLAMFANLNLVSSEFSFLGYCFFKPGGQFLIYRFRDESVRYKDQSMVKNLSGCYSSFSGATSGTTAALHICTGEPRTFFTWRETWKCSCFFSCYRVAFLLTLSTDMVSQRAAAWWLSLETTQVLETLPVWNHHPMVGWWCVFFHNLQRNLKI